LDNDNGNIPKSAALAVGRALSYVVMSDTISPNFACYMVEAVARDIRDLYPEGDTQKMRAALVEAVAHGGVHRPKPGYPRRLSALLGQLDPLLAHEVSDLSEAIRLVAAEGG
jgi:hypothetical protein